MAQARRGSRCVAIVGAHQAGKTTLLESLLHAAGAISRRGRPSDGTAVGDTAPETRGRHTTVELNIASCVADGDAFTFVDCPGSLELFHDVRLALGCCDAAIVVCDPSPERVQTVAPLLRALDAEGIPHVVFVNRLDGPDLQVRALVAALQEVSPRPLVLREVPLREGREVVGLVDLASQRAYRFGSDSPSTLVEVPKELRPRVEEARRELLERLADFDDALLTDLLEDRMPAPQEVFAQIERDVCEDLVVPVFLGSAEQGRGVRTLLKALRYEVPGVERVRERLGIEDGDGPLASVLRVRHLPHAGRSCVVRVLRGELRDGAPLAGDRISGIASLLGATSARVEMARAGDVVALGRIESARPGAIVDPEVAVAEPVSAPLPMQSLAVGAERHVDEVKLSGALQKLSDEDPALSSEVDGDTHELVLRGQGELHLGVAIDRLRHRLQVPVEPRVPAVAYRETIRHTTAHHTRFRKQTGGHGQYADVTIIVQPLPRGEGFRFDETVVGGAVPRQYFGAVEQGARDALEKGPLGFPVVDVAVTLTGGQHHSVDSSEQAFRTCARMAVLEALTASSPVLLEPFEEVALRVPREATSRTQRLVATRRGQILGLESNDDGTDVVLAQLPRAEMQDLAPELRAVSHGLGTFTTKASHLVELDGRIANKVLVRAGASQG